MGYKKYLAKSWKPTTETKKPKKTTKKSTTTKEPVKKPKKTKTTKKNKIDS